MIRLPEQPKPKQLTDSMVKTLTDKFAAEGTDVWKQKYIIDALLLMSNNKCCYCECKIDEESKYLEIEHFHPKQLYPLEVVLWENLLPSCKHCNGAKGNHDTIAEPIIHPVNDDPKEHLYLMAYRFYPKRGSALGNMTRDVVNLNDRKRLTDKRYEIGSKIIDDLERLLDACRNYENGNKSTRRKNHISIWLKNLMIEGTKSYEYSCTAATTILNDPSYDEIKAILIEELLWSEELDQLEGDMKYCAMSISDNSNP